VPGTPVSPFDYFTGTVREHALGIGGGMIWMLGTTSNFVAASALGEARVGPAVSYGLGQGATMISVLWGLLYWKEFAGSDAKVKTLLAVMFFAFLIGLTMVSTAPLFPK
jgi:glucose uptake protein